MKLQLSGTFHHHQEKEENKELKCPFSPRKSRKSFSCTRGRETKNPYADRGLEKFSALLADLEDKKKKIYTQIGSEEISFVRFAYSNSNHCKPIVVRVKDKKKQENVKDHKSVTSDESETFDKHPIESSTSDANIVVEKAKKKRFKGDNWRDHSYYLVGGILILILVFLAMFGKSFTILCTSLGWYLAPTINGGRASLERNKKKKNEKTRKVIENKVLGDGLSSPRSVLTRAMNTDSPRQQRGHCKSW